MRPPSPGNWSSRYGMRTASDGTVNFHHGLDIGWAAGRNLVAPEDGEIIHYGRIPGWRLGQISIIRGKSGYDHWLCHTDKSLRGLGPVKEGELVAYMGTTDAPGQLHVHWETRKNGERLDPEAWLASFAGGGAVPFPEQDLEEEDGMILVEDKDGRRGRAMWSGSMWERLQNSEELTIVNKHKDRMLRISTREFDVLRAIVTRNKKQVNLSSASRDELVKKVVASLPADSSVTVEQIRDALNGVILTIES